MSRFVTSLSVVLAALASDGCRRGAQEPAAPPPQVVSVSRPLVRDVQDYVEFTGRTDAVESVEVRARVTGYLEKIAFRDGTEVKAGDLLFIIDQRPFKAAYDRTLAEVQLREANMRDRLAEFNRAKSLLPDNAISRSDYDNTQAAYEESVAAIAAAKAEAESARLNLDFTRISAPVAGRISRTIITKGNLVKADETLLTTVVTQDPIYVYFDVDERTLLRVARMLMVAKERVLETNKVKLLMGLSDEDGFPHVGHVDFADNVVDSSTGTIVARGVFANPAAPSGARLLRPGMFVRVRLPLGEARKSILVAERALATDQGKKYLLAVNGQQTVEYRRVEVGPLQDDGLRVIAAGLDLGERVIVSGLQLVRPKMRVQAEEVPMLAPAPEPAPPQHTGQAAPGPRS